MYYVFGPLIAISGVLFVIFTTMEGVDGPTVAALIYLIPCMIAFCCLLLIDIHLILNGNSLLKSSMTTDSYIRAACMIYLDVLSIFLFIMTLFD